MSKSGREPCLGCSRITVRKLGLYDAVWERASWEEVPSRARPVNQIELGGACARGWKVESIIKCLSLSEQRIYLHGMYKNKHACHYK